MPNEPIAVSHLLVDTINPRLRNGVSDQPNAIAAVIEAHPEKFLDLAKSISKLGTDPSNLPIVVPSGNQDGFYTVIEGNRRLSALKCLSNPKLADSALTASQRARLTKAAGEYASHVIRKLECTVYQTRTEAKQWIELKHLSTADGAAMQAWGPREKRNYAERESGVKAPGMQVLDFAKDHGGLSAALKARIEKKFNITTLERILNDEAAMSALGLEIVDGVVRSRYPIKQSGKAIGRIVDDIASGKLPVKKVYTSAQIVSYANTVVGEELSPNAKQGASVPLVIDQPTKGAAKRKSGSKKAGASATHLLIPKSCHLHIDLQKIDALYRELQRLNIDDYTNCAGVAFRVFFETSLDHYLIAEVGKTESDLAAPNAKLTAKVAWVEAHLKAHSPLSKHDLHGLMRATNKDYYPETITTMHGFVHSRHFMAAPSELRAQWTGMRPVFEYIWRDKTAATGAPVAAPKKKER